MAISSFESWEVKYVVIFKWGKCPYLGPWAINENKAFVTMYKLKGQSSNMQTGSNMRTGLSS